MGKFRVRTNKGASKKQRWEKGQSSSSNPSKTKHRDAAKSRMLRSGFGQQPASATPSGLGRLTAECLLRHEALMGQAGSAKDESSMDADSEAGSVALTSDSTVKTFATDFSQCTNVSFNKLTQRFSGNNVHHREMLAILAAITQVIKTKDGEGSSTEYFSALCTTLESAETKETTTAVVTLISMVIKSVPVPILQSHFPPISKLFMECLSRQDDASEQNLALIRQLIGCLSVLLRAQTYEAWQDASTLRIFDSLLSFCTHSKPKVRKASQHAVTVILKASRFLETAEDSKLLHPAAGNVAKYCSTNLEENMGGSNMNAVLHTMVLLKDVVSVFPKNHVKSSCEAILKIMASGEPRALSCGFQVLYGLFAGRPSKSSLPAELNVQIAAALYDYMPSINDAQPMVAWLTVQQEAHVNLGLQNHKLCLLHLPKFFTTTIKCWTSDKPTVCTAATTAMKALCNECIKPNVTDVFDSDAASDEKNAVKKVFHVIEEGLNYQYNSVWPQVFIESMFACFVMIVIFCIPILQVFHLMSAFIDVAGKECQSVIGKCLTSLADLRASMNFSLENELDHVVGRAIRKMGPEAVLSFVPLKITGREETFEFPRSWLLPIMRENIQNTELAFFKSYFLPLAANCKARSNQAKRENDTAVAKPYDILVCQIWALLPGFCNNPTDLKESFKGLAKTLGETLQNMKELRIDILSSLRQLISKSRGKPEKEAELARFAKNFLPILFNLYTTKPVGAEETGQRQSVYETMKQFFAIAPTPLMHDMFDRAFEKHQDPNCEPFLKESCLDILQAMLPYQDALRIERLYNVCTAHMGDKDFKQQKRAYRVLEELFSSENCQDFVSEHLEQIQTSFLEALSTASPTSQAYRLKCLIHIVRNLEEDHTQFVYKIVPEAVLCIKATNEKARTGSYTLLVVIGEALQRWKEGELDLVVKDYLQVILAGLAGNPTTIHCTILAMTRIFYEFKDIFPDDLVELMVENVCLLLTSQSREVVGSAMSFLHVFVTSNDVLKSAKFVEGIVKAMLKMPDDCMRHFRLKTRYLIDRLVRKFGYDLISALVPKDNAQMHKRLKNIRKAQAKKKKDKEAAEAIDEDSDDEDKFKIKSKPKTIGEILADSSDESDMDENDDSSNKKKRKGKKTPQSFISVDKENADEGIVDFLDATASQNIMSTLPKKTAAAGDQNKAKKKSQFPIGPDGRLIIKDLSDDDDDDEEDMEGPSKNMQLDSDSDEDGEKSENTFQKLVSTRKRKHGTSVASGRSRASTTASGPAMKYRTGGTGIHRPLKTEKQDYGSEYRAKKGKGDVKVKGRPDPHAYVPLQKSSLNKRKKAKFEGQFNSLVKATKKGAASGKKGFLVNKLKKMSVKN